MSSPRDEIKPGDEVYHLVTKAGPFKVLKVGSNATSDWPNFLEPGYFIHSGGSTRHERVDDYGTRKD